MDLDGPKGGRKTMHPHNLFLHRTGCGHILCGEELVPSWTLSLCQIGETGFDYGDTSIFWRLERKVIVNDIRNDVF